jgi:hypothetical protein
MKKNASARSRNRLLIVALTCGFLAAGSILKSSSADAPDVFRGKGESAFAVMFNIDINGTIYPRVQINVFRDVSSGKTNLVINAFEVPNVFQNRTIHRLAGPIAGANFVLAPDLSSASLSTVLNTSGNAFNNAEVGPLVNYGIDLDWSADTIGNLVDTSVFNGRTVGNPGVAFRDTFHQNGPHAEGGVTGTMGPTNITSAFGTIDANRSFEIFQPR